MTAKMTIFMVKRNWVNFRSGSDTKRNEKRNDKISYVVSLVAINY